MAKWKSLKKITMSPPWTCVDWWNFPQRKLVWYFLFFSENCWILRCLVIGPLTLLTLYECVWEFFGSKVTSLYSGHCRDLELVSLLARVRNSGSLCQSIYFCLGFSCCPYYWGVRYSGVSARRELSLKWIFCSRCAAIYPTPGTCLVTATREIGETETNTSFPIFHTRNK